jgi:hypothetical protein
MSEQKNQNESIQSTRAGTGADAPGTDGKPTQGPVCRIITDIPGVLPVLPSEVALVATWWPALVQLISANDNAADGSGDNQGGGD